MIMISRFSLQRVSALLLIGMLATGLTACTTISDASSSTIPSSAATSSQEAVSSTASGATSSEQASSAAASSQASSVATDSSAASAASSVGTAEIIDGNWSLILVNADHILEKITNANLVELKDIPLSKAKGRYFDKRAASDLYAMFVAAKEDGINLYSRSTYRTYNTQKTYYDAHVNDYKKQGMTTEEAKKKTEEYTMKPGASEHHTGLAIDITTSEWEKAGRGLSVSFAETDAGKWLKNNAHKYGFILRYTKEKEAITKVKYEPWHFRYVGIEHAEKIYTQGICLEEYLEQLT